MFKLLGFLFKMLIIVVAVFLIAQLEYKGQKIQTYFVEIFKSKPVTQGVNYVKTVVGDEDAKKKQAGLFKKSKTLSDHYDSERRQLQSLMED